MPAHISEPQDTDRVLIVGGGIAGSLLALILARDGHAVTVFDPHRTPKPMFRNEKLGTEQIALLRELEALDCFASVCHPPKGHPHAYTANPSLTDCGAHHHDWVASVRSAWPASVRFVEAMIEQVETSVDRQTVITPSGERFTGRLVVLASGRMPALRASLGIQSRTISENHSVCLGFSLTTDRFIASRIFFPLSDSGIGYVSVFPMPGETRVNIFSFRGLNHPWTRAMSRDPLTGLAEICPEAAQWLQGAELKGRCEARGTDLYKVSGHRRDGVVLIGDAFHSPCPASGTGMLRVLYDVSRLARHHLPHWLATPGMGRDKIVSFYNDPVKRRNDRTSLKSSLRGRGNAVGTGPYWTARRILRKLKGRLSLDFLTRPKHIDQTGGLL
ncbi:MAG: FAD-dependent monooxygenase [Asticcacaulis sp.]|uniref:FAD-dependent oxidoreductase n=1 Tax=Asticcacaulis sp. TaxID=1872648 RepID=UPI0039E72B78